MLSEYGWLALAVGHFIVFCQAEDGILDIGVTGVQTCALPICRRPSSGGATSTVGSSATGAIEAIRTVPCRPPKRPTVANMTPPRMARATMFSSVWETRDRKSVA